MRDEGGANAEEAVSLGDGPGERWASLARAAKEVGRDTTDALALAVRLGSDVPMPGRGQTEARWEALATLAAVDVSVARVVEPHLDALAILAEASLTDLAPEGSTWGVYAAEGPGVRLEAVETGRTVAEAGRWTLTGTKPWCSLADDVSHALVTAWVDDEQRGLFAAELGEPWATGVDEAWTPHGLADIRSAPVVFTEAPAVAVGAPGWYLQRDGFAWGGIGVAAAWYGGAVGVLRRMQRQAAERTLDQIGELHLGTADAAMTAARTVLAASATAIDEGRAAGEDGAVLALRVRQVVHDAAETTLRAAEHALGPAPLAREADFADRVADLRLYLRQHHGERDLAALGRAVAEERPW
jgi:alkylation response protein AidB-like acyl-CoA dehydrogenase